MKHCEKCNAPEWYVLHMGCGESPEDCAMSARHRFQALIPTEVETMASVDIEGPDEPDDKSEDGTRWVAKGSMSKQLDDTWRQEPTLDEFDDETYLRWWLAIDADRERIKEYARRGFTVVAAEAHGYMVGDLFIDERNVWFEYEVVFGTTEDEIICIGKVVLAKGLYRWVMQFFN